MGSLFSFGKSLPLGAFSKRLLSAQRGEVGERLDLQYRILPSRHGALERRAHPRRPCGCAFSCSKYCSEFHAFRRTFPSAFRVAFIYSKCFPELHAFRPPFSCSQHDPELHAFRASI